MKLALPHWAQIVLGLVGALLGYLLAQNASGALVLPGALVSVLALVQMALGLFSSSVMQPAAQPAAASAGGVEASVASATAAEAAALEKTKVN